jgi:hypothetical protein
MEEKRNLIEDLFEKLVSYTETSLEIFKLKFIEKISDVFSSLLSRLILLVFLGMFLFIFSIGVSFWLGDLLGEVYYGFLIVAAFYLLMAVIMILLHPSIKKKIADSIISNILR